MKKSRIFVILVVLSGLVNGCSEKEPKLMSVEGEGQYLIFGSFYGFCAGDQCVRYFLLKDNKLFKLNNVQPNQNFPVQYAGMTELPQDAFSEVQELPNDFPIQLFEMEDTIIGCPDCADGGGVYVETKINNEKRYWYLDNTLSEPEYLRAFINTVNQKINLISGN